MIQVTKLNGEKYWINPHQIETMEMNPDVTLLMLSGKKIVVKDSPEEVLARIVEYRKKIGLVGNEH
jgi:flagellar protein FlbD